MGSYYSIPKAIFYLLKRDFTLNPKPGTKQLVFGSMRRALREPPTHLRTLQ